jgi:hypothetical protein
VVHVRRNTTGATHESAPSSETPAADTLVSRFGTLGETWCHLGWLPAAGRVELNPRSLNQCIAHGARCQHHFSQTFARVICCAVTVQLLRHCHCQCQGHLSSEAQGKMLEEKLSRTFSSGRWQNVSVAAKSRTTRHVMMFIMHSIAEVKVRKAERSMLFKD